MPPTLATLPAGLMLLCAVALPAAAESLASSASSQISESVGSLSNSVQGSSNASSGERPVAEGNYRVVELAAAPDQPGQLRLSLQAQAAAGTRPGDGVIYLELPQAVAVQQHLAAGQLITAHLRPYGVEFAQADTQRAFYLLLDDASLRELPSHAVTL